MRALYVFHTRYRGTPPDFYPYRKSGLDHGIGQLASMSPQKNERLTPSKG
jgi:hypothetical protein